MSRVALWMGLVLAAVLFAHPASAEDAGQDDLDQAIDAKLGAQSVDDLAEVIRLCESSLKKGLDESNAPIAKKLLAAALLQRGGVAAQSIVGGGQPGPQWRKMRDEALADLDRAVEVDPAQVEAWSTIAQLNLLPGGNRQRAGEALDAVIRLGTERPEQQARMLILRADLEDVPKKKLAHLDKAVELAPDEPAVYRARGMIRAMLGKIKPALADFDKAIELDPQNAASYSVKALALGSLGEYEQAMAALDKAHELAPGAALPLVQRARIRLLQSDAEAALEDIDLALGLEPGDLEALLLRIAILQKLDRTEEALADADRAAKLQPDRPAVLRIRAALYVAAGKVDQAIEQFEKVVEKDPKDVHGRLQLAMLYAAGNRSAKAVEAYTVLLEQLPGQWMILRDRADALLAIGRHAPAITDYEKALKLNPSDSQMLNNLAWVLATSPDDEVRNGRRARKLAKKACELTDHQQAHILSTLAATYAEMGDFESAIKWSKKALEAADTEADKEALAKELESYQAGKPVRERQTAPEEP